MNTLLQDLRISVRQMRKEPVFFVIAILTLALGIGANVAVFSVMNAVLLNPQGVPGPKDLVTGRVSYQNMNLLNIGMSAPDFNDLASSDLVTSAAAMQVSSFNLSENGVAPERLLAANVTWQWFNVFRANPILGRIFQEEEDLPNANHEVVLSYGAWVRRFGSDPSIVGKSIQLDRKSHQIIGVMGKEFNWPNQAEIWVPLGLAPGKFHDDDNYRYNENLFTVARLKNGATSQQLNAYLRTKSQQNVLREGQKSFGQSSGWGMFALPLVEFTAGDMAKALMILLLAVCTVLLIACANIAGLQLARASGRRRETSVRIALGAQRTDLIRQALVESLALAVLGAAFGVLFAKLTIPVLTLMAPPSITQNLAIRMNGPVFWYIAAAGVVSVLICGAAPAWQMTHIHWFQALQEGGRSESTSPARQRLRSGLVVGEIALAMLLIVVAGLLLESLRSVEKVSTGFDPQGVLSAGVSLPDGAYDSDIKQAAFFSAVEQNLKNIPGVTSVAVADAVPFSNQGGSASFVIPGQTRSANDPGPHGNIRAISPEYFQTLRIPLERGRIFSDEDRSKSQPVVIIDDVLEKRYWPNEDPIGKQMGFGGKSPFWTIVGIVKHARTASLESDTGEGFYFLPFAQNPQLAAQLMVRSDKLTPNSLKSGVEGAVHEIDPNQPIYDVKSMNLRIDESFLGRRFLVVLLTIFAALALLLAALGLYGVVSYSVRMRTRELGVRMALGAQRKDVMRLVLVQGMRLATAGVVLGVLATFACGRILSTFLYQVRPWNPANLFTAAILLAVTVLFASYFPARRASLLDPMTTIRDE
jgi:predicted permease